MFALLVPSCCDKSGTICYHHACYKVDDGNRLATSCSNKIYNTACIVTRRYELVVINLLKPVTDEQVFYDKFLCDKFYLLV